MDFLLQMRVVENYHTIDALVADGGFNIASQLTAFGTILFIFFPPLLEYWTDGYTVDVFEGYGNWVIGVYQLVCLLALSAPDIVRSWRRLRNQVYEVKFVNKV